MMKRMYTIRIIGIICTICIASCDLVDYHPYDGRVKGAKGINAQNIPLIERNCRDKDTIRIVHISDTQRWYDETELLVKAINGRTDVDFVIHTGDHTDFGMTKEFMWMRDIYQKLHIPYVCIIGNHDCLGTGEDIFLTVFGDVNFSFNASFLHFVGLNTNAFEYDYSTAVPDFQFIENDISLLTPEVTRTVVAMHAIPGSERFNNNVSNYFKYMIEKYPDLIFCLSGHGHHSGVHYPFENGVPYFECASAKEKSYMLYTITRDSYDYELVEI